MMALGWGVWVGELSNKIRRGPGLVTAWVKNFCNTNLEA